MSWQTYVDDHLMYEIEGTTNHLSAAATLRIDGSVWAQSANFPQFKPDEIATAVKDFDKPGILAPTGLHLVGTKYMVIQGEPGAVIRGKKEYVSRHEAYTEQEINEVQEQWAWFFRTKCLMK